MSHGTDYQRYKHKLERLQSKVKRSENARRELEIRFQRLMKERNECEKTASIHKSKYNSLLKNERKRLSRNEELLQMLEDVQTKAANLASNTERLKMLKNQQERILVNSWRRNACLQQHLFYPNAIYPNAVQYAVLPSPPLASSSTLSSQPAVISSTHDYQNSAINSISSVKPIAVYGKSSCFVDNPDVIYRNPTHEEHPSTIQSFINSANIVAHHQPPLLLPPPTISQQQQLKLGSSLMPLYHNEPFHPLYNNFYIRSHEPPSQSSYQETTSFTPNRNINKDITKLHDIGHNQSIRDKKSNTIAPGIGQRSSDDTRFPLHLNKSQPYDHHHQYYSQIEPFSRTINQFPFDDGSTSSQINVPISSQMGREYTHLSDQINEIKIPMNVNSHEQQHQQRQQQQQHGKNESNTDPSVYGDEREMISNANDIDSMNQYERNTNDKCNEPFKGDPNNDVYANNNGYKPAHIESIDLRKSISNTTTASTSNVTPSSTTMTAIDFTLNDTNAQHNPYSAAGTSTFDGVSNERDHYPYKGISDRTYTSMHSKELHDDNDDDGGGKKVTLERSNSHTLFPIENKQKIIKRRSSIDADSFAKTLGHDINPEKESIAANIRRRYSVAANFLNLPNNTANDANSFDFTPNVNANEYRNNTRAWVNNNNNNTSTFHANANANEPDRSSFDTNNNMNGSTVIVQNQIDMRRSSTVDTNDGYLGQQDDQQNINQYDNGATPYATATYTMDDQTYVENAMEQLKLDENGEHRSADGMKPIQFDDSADRIRASGKTVTWADDPESNYKKQVTANMYESQNMTNVDSSPDQYYANQSDTQQQQQQQQQIQQHDYLTTDGNRTADGANESPHYQYDNNNQYDNGQYQYQTQPDAVGTNDGYYYGNEQMNQYDQYLAQPEAQPQQQEDTQYYATEATNINDGSMNDGYQQFQTEQTLQVQPKQDEYYTVSPGENYYTDYENINENQTYAVPSNVGNVAQQKQNQSQKQPQQQQQQQQYQPQSNLPNQPNEPIHVPNYLQSDTDDSQTGYPNQTTIAAPQSQDSDFDFSTNS